jgi:hypothetical protein
MSVAVAFSVFTSAASDANLAGGAVSDKSRWLAADGDPLPWIELAFPKPVKVGALDIFSGDKSDGALEAFDLTFEVDGKWVSPAAGKVRDDIGERNDLSATHTNEFQSLETKRVACDAQLIPPVFEGLRMPKRATTKTNGVPETTTD